MSNKVLLDELVVLSKGADEKAIKSKVAEVMRLPDKDPAVKFILKQPPFSGVIINIEKALVEKMTEKYNDAKTELGSKVNDVVDINKNAFDRQETKLNRLINEIESEKRKMVNPIQINKLENMRTHLQAIIGSMTCPANGSEENKKAAVKNIEDQIKSVKPIYAGVQKGTSPVVESYKKLVHGKAQQEEQKQGKENVDKQEEKSTVRISRCG